MSCCFKTTPEAARPERAEALYITWYLKAFALTGRQARVNKSPGRCPGLGASALSGRIASGSL